MTDARPPLERLTLQRIKQTDFATYGELYNEHGRQVCKTLELPWKDNAPNISCIPAGEYIAERRHSEKHHGVVFGLLFVPNRSDIELHVGNLPVDTLGCILLGLEFGHVEKADGHKGDGILGSKTAFLSFMADHPGQRLWLHIVDPSPSLPEHPL